MNKKKSKLIKNTMIFLIGNIGSKFIQFLLVPLYTYTMTSSDFGNADLVLTTINFLMPIFSLQLSDGLLRFGMDKSLNKTDVYSVTLKVLFICSTITIILSPILLFIESFKNFVLFFILILNLRIYRDILAIILKVEDKNKIFSIDSIIYSFSLSLSALLFLSVFKIGIVGYFLSYVVANVISIIFILFNINIKIKIKIKKNKELTKSLIIYSLPMIINSLSYWITTASDRYMIKIFLTLSSVGIYAVAAKIPTIITTFTGIFNQAWMLSSISEYENDRDVRFYNDVFSFYCSISFITCALLILIIKPFMHVYVSSEYFIAWEYASVLIVSAIFSGISAFINGIFYAYKKNISATITTTIGAIINIILNFIFIPKYGIMGASVATLISWFLITVVRIISVKRIIDIKIEWFKLSILTMIIFIELINVIIINNNFSFLINIILVLGIIFIERKALIMFVEGIIKKQKIWEKTRKIMRYISGRDNKYRRNLKNENFSIISQNCTGGLIYHFLGEKFLSPTINIYFSAKDFLKFCENLDYYLECKPEQKKTDLKYPVMKLDDITIYGVHYNNYDEFLLKWEERKKRINKNNLFIIMTERDGCEYKDLLEFDKLDYNNKIVFTHKKYDEIKSSYYVKGTMNNSADKKTHLTKSLTDYKSKISPFRYIDDFDFVSWLNQGGK